MTRNRRSLLVLAVLALLAAAAFLLFRARSGNPLDAREALLNRLPEEATSIVYIDLQELRASPFLTQLLSLAPSPEADEDYKKFVAATGFQYERDLDRVAISFGGTAQSPHTVMVAQGRFDKAKVEAYNKQSGALKTASGRTIYSIPLRQSSRSVYFTFLQNDEVALCSDANCFFEAPPRTDSTSDRAEHLLRLAGTPAFLLLRQDSPLLSSLSQSAPGGFRSPQLANLLGQLQWLSISAKPDGPSLRVVVDGESSSELVTRQLGDMVSGLLLLAEAGLNDPKSRQKLDARTLEAYRQVLQSADVQKIDRGRSKSVRLLFELSPASLQAAKEAPSATDPPKKSASH